MSARAEMAWNFRPGIAAIRRSGSSRGSGGISWCSAVIEEEILVAEIVT
jgi:hypothetical protein